MRPRKPSREPGEALPGTPWRTGKPREASRSLQDHKSWPRLRYVGVAALWWPIKFKSFINVVRNLLWGALGAKPPRINRGAWGSPPAGGLRSGNPPRSGGGSGGGAATPQETLLKSWKVPVKSPATLSLSEGQQRWKSRPPGAETRLTRVPVCANSSSCETL